MQLIKGTTKLLAVIGDPVKHSLSPIMHNAAIADLAVDYVYLAFPVSSESLEMAIAGFEAIDLVGFSITIPHKRAILPFLAQVSPIAEAVGAVNTVWRTEKGWYGTNTDVAGFIAPLKSLNQDWQQVSPTILGNGGAARAVVAGCAELGCPEIKVVGRNQQRLDDFQQSWGNSGLQAQIKAYTWDELPGLVSETKLLVNTTPVGMYPDSENSPVDAKLMEKLPANAIAYDLIYTPKPTKFLQLAAQQGAMSIDGLEMLVQQGAAALEIWLQQPAPVEVMRQSLLNYLGFTN
ncbi:MAG: shikimate dehydrogenase [Oscillatoria sp. PMC 1068.18]|nr:shikimate dehydrogenase [Oscillatoria sp. PMC 1076.18]MEC4988532.1 shikimate dehydrogenase [Oscillatoria sp. PMC 1068.18]